MGVRFHFEMCLGGIVELRRLRDGGYKVWAHVLRHLWDMKLRLLNCLLLCFFVLVLDKVVGHGKGRKKTL